LRLVSINPKDLGCDGHAVETISYKNRKQTGFSEADIIYSFAGEIAEQKFTGKKGDGSGRDNAIIRAHLWDLPERKRKAVRDDLKARTVKLVDDNWQAIVDVAKELIRVGTISGERIDVIVSRVGGPDPWE
jgi:hypothetical protein